jgi:hypothetical protein
MHRPTRTRLTGILAAALAASLAASPISAATHDAVAVPNTTTADLAQALGADGAFRGAPGLAGTVDASAWTLTSNLAAGEAPRFAPATAVTPAAAAPAGSWAAVGTNGSGGASLNNLVFALAVSGTDLYVGGGFTDVAGNSEATYVVKWNGSAWSNLGNNGAGVGPLNNVAYALAVSGSDVYVGGAFTDAAGIPEADYVAKWNGSAWSSLGDNGAGVGALNNVVTALAVSGTDLYVGGGFTTVAGDAKAANMAKWSAGAWSALGDNGAGGAAITNTVNRLVVSGSDLYVGGWFQNAGGIAEADRVAKWSAGAWSALGSNGAGDGAITDVVEALGVSGSDLYVGGRFVNAAGLPTADYLAKWNGSAWSAVGSNLAGTDGALNFVPYAFAFSGSDVYVGGGFTDAGGILAADYIAKWNGSTWSALGSGSLSGGGALAGAVYDLAIIGTDLFVGGQFTDAAGIAIADKLAAWGMAPTPPAVVRKPDGRIRLGTTGAFTGDNVYNLTGTAQSRTGSALRGHVLTFGISIQNDGTATDSFKVKATGTATTKYTVKYYRGTTDITTKVVAGTYKTSTLAKGAAFLITAKVTVKWSATKGSSVTRLVTVTSVASTAQRDAVKLVGKRK